MPSATTQAIGTILRTRTPEISSAPVAKLCRRLSPHETPIYVPVRPASGAAANDCFVNVPKVIKRSGGCLQHGWSIWEWPGVLVEGEFHCVWVDPNGNRIDVTPKSASVEKILFLPDPIRKFVGRQVDNERMPVRNDPLVHDFIELGKKRFVLFNKGDRADKMGVITIPADELRPHVVASRLVEAMLRAGLTANDKCACESGRKYKNCCGPNIRRFQP